MTFGRRRDEFLFDALSNTKAVWFSTSQIDICKPIPTKIDFLGAKINNAQLTIYIQFGCPQKLKKELPEKAIL